MYRGPKGLPRLPRSCQEPALVTCCSRAVGGGFKCNGAPSTWSGFGGTSVFSPIMAGIQALVNQRTDSRWGNLTNVGRDFPTGIGSVNAWNLVMSWPFGLRHLKLGTLAMPEVFPGRLTAWDGKLYSFLWLVTSGFSQLPCLS